MSKEDLKDKIVIWDKDGTITESRDPNDKTSKSKTTLPGVEKAMNTAKFNFIISGFKSPESEAQNFNPKTVAESFMELMNKLPIKISAFSPEIGGIACYVVIKKGKTFSVVKAHKNPIYKHFIGKFKKPNTGMFHVVKDIAYKEFGIKITESNAIMVGDTWHDEAAAHKFRIPFLQANLIHR